MTVTDVEDAPAEAPRRGRRINRGWVGLLSVAALAAAWIAVGTNPAVTQGSFFGPPPAGARIATDGVTDTRLVMPGEPGRTYEVPLSLRNAGRVPFTVLGLDGENPLLHGIALHADPYAEGYGSRYWAEGAEQISLGPGDEVGVVVSIGVPECLIYQEGGWAEFDTLPLRVRQLGLTTTQDVETFLPLTLTGTTPDGATPPEGC